MDPFVIALLIMGGTYITGIFATAFILGVMARSHPEWTDNDKEYNQVLMFFWPLILTFGSMIGIYAGIAWIAKKIYSLGARQPKFVMPDNEVLLRDINRELEIDAIVKELDKELGLEPTTIDVSEMTLPHNHERDCSAIDSNLACNCMPISEVIRQQSAPPLDINKITQTMKEYNYDYGP